MLARPMKLILALSISGAVLALPMPALAAPAGTADTGAALDAALDRIADRADGPPGVSVLIQRGSKSDYRRRGLANVAAGTPPTPRLAMRIASVSKAFSGAVALELVERGKLRLNETIGQRLPGLLPRANKVTLRQVLNHTGGLPDYIRDPAFLRRLKANPAARMSPRRLLSFVRKTPLRFRPGSRYEYSDSDNIVVGLMAEAATGVSYERLMKRLIFRPLGLRNTTLPTSLRLPDPFLHGYAVVPGKAPEDASRLINPTLAWASGGMVSTPPELARFFRAYVGGRLFSGPARRAQRRFVAGSSSPPGPGRNAASLGLFRYRTSCGTVYGHTGSFPGYRLFAAASANGSRAVVFAVNAQIVPGQGSPKVSRLIRAAQTAAVCHALR